MRGSCSPPWRPTLDAGVAANTAARSGMRRSPSASRNVTPSRWTDTSVAPSPMSCPAATSLGPLDDRNSAKPLPSSSAITPSRRRSPATLRGVASTAAGAPAGAKNNPDARNASAGSAGAAGVNATGAGPNQRQPHHATTSASNAAAARSAKAPASVSARDRSAAGATPAVIGGPRTLRRYNRSF